MKIELTNIEKLIQNEIKNYTEEEFEKIYDLAFIFYRKIQNLYNLLKWKNDVRNENINYKINKPLIINSILFLLKNKMDFNEKKICVDLTIDNLEKYFLNLNKKEKRLPAFLTIGEEENSLTYSSEKMSDYFLEHLNQTMVEREEFNKIKIKLKQTNDNTEINPHKNKFKI